jgi:hypothetical protein
MAISGTLIDLAAPDSNDIHAADIIFQMARIGRYNGATLTSHLWTVGDHLRVCLAVYRAFCEIGLAEYDPEMAAALLLHDAQEIYTGDMTSPLKRLLRQRNELELFDEITERFDEAIAVRFGLPYPLSPADHDFMKDIDLFAYEVEKALHRPVLSDNVPLHPLTKRLLQSPEMQMFKTVLPLDRSWQALYETFFDVAADLPDPRLFEALMTFRNPYYSGQLDRTEETLADHLRCTEEGQIPAYQMDVSA